jgi:hypothetical protein
MTGAEDRHQVAAGAVLALLEAMGQLVELADRALQVLLLDLIICSRHSGGWFRRALAVSFGLHLVIPP